MFDVNPDAAVQNPPARPPINRRRLLLSAAGGVGALALVGGARWWADRGAERGPRLWDTTAASGRVLLADGPQQAVYVSGYDGTVRALDPGTGAVRWSRTVGAPDPVTESIGGRPAVVGSGVVCVTGTTGLQAFDAATGEPRWQVPVPEWSDLPWGTGPALGGGTVYAVHGGSLHAYDAATGETRWSRAADVSGHLAADGDGVYAAGAAAGVRAFDARTGGPRWTEDTLVPTGSTPLVHRGAVLFAHATGAAATTGVSSLDAATGRVRWRRTQRGATNCPLSVAGGTACFLSGTRLTGFDTETGEPRWQSSVVAGLGRGESSMTVAEGGVYVGTNDERLFAYALDTGKLRWQDAPEKLRSDTEYTRVSLAATGTTVFRSTLNGGVHALGASA
ncbi:PQQ-binding-like beta-propeller repeat protein [Kitasatospora sp. NPDC101176]|uniref:PQQ-binding-like beta-propeller repeat protein n=1 Tax=Kitasatospora sp. NPDC101176 TaxID=3364099 RepID=UPI0038301BFC